MKSAPVGGASRWDILGIQNCSLRLSVGHVVTARDHICGDFKDEFDWSSLPVPYRKRIGDPSLRSPKDHPPATIPAASAALPSQTEPQKP